MEFRISRWNFIVLFLFLYSIGSAQKSNYWSPLPKPTPHTLDRVHFVDSLRGWITGQNGVLMYTSDGGQSWVQQISGITGEIPDIFMQNEKVGWAVAIQYPQDDTSWFGTNILHTTNGGMEWSVQRYDSVIFRTIFFQDSLTGFMGGSYGVIVKTTNGGQSWHKVSDSAQHKFPVYKIKFYSQNYGFAVGGQLEIAGVIWRTTDGGETWRSKIVSGDPVFNLHYFDSAHVYCGMGDIDQAGAGFLRTVDGGFVWDFENTTIWGEPTAFAFRTIEEGWVPMGIAGLCLKTTDEGITWEQIPVPGQTPVYDISFPDERTGYMVGFKGALFKYNPNVLSVERSNEPTLSFALKQNFPNPFNGTTTITYHISKQSHVKLLIFDILGRLVETLIDNVQSEGEQKIRWDSKNFPSGMYVYRLNADRVMKSGTMILLR